MAVYVDYGAGSVLFEVEASEAFTAPVSDEVLARGQDVYGYLTDLEGSADSAAADAIDKINKLLAFSASVPTVEFDIPDAPEATLQEAPDLPALNTESPDISSANLNVNLQYSLLDGVDGGWATPDDVEFVAPPAPGMSPEYSVPTAPAAYEMPATSAPVLAPVTFVPDELSPPALEEIDFSTMDLAVIEEFTLDVDVSGIIDAIEQLNVFDATPPTLPEYTYLIPEVFEVVGSMASGDTIVQYQQLLDSRVGLLAGTAPATYLSFSRRGLAPPDGASAYDTWLNSVLHQKLDDSDIVFEAVAIDDCVKSAFQLGTAAYRMLVDIETALYGLDFSLAKAAVNASLEKAKSVVAIYRSELLILQTLIAQYNAAAAYVTANAKIFEVNAAQIDFIGGINTVTADTFATEESVKGVASDVFKSRISAEAAKLTQYKAVINSLKSFVADATLSVATYSGAVAKHSAEVERISSRYDIYSTQAQSIQFDNSARAAALQAEGSSLLAYSSEADSAAARAAAKSIDLQARAAEREAVYAENALDNDQIAMEFRVTGAEYDKLVTEYVTNLQARGVDLSGKSALGRSIAQYVTSAQEAVGRAAQLSQTANVQLAQAYAAVYEAAGNAGAAVSSGKLSGFRASASMSASESLQASDSYATRYASSGGTSKSESIRYEGSI